GTTMRIGVLPGKSAAWPGAAASAPNSSALAARFRNRGIMGMVSSGASVGPMAWMVGSGTLDERRQAIRRIVFAQPGRGALRDGTRAVDRQGQRGQREILAGHGTMQAERAHVRLGERL